MQQPPPTDPKTDLKSRCMWCGKTVLNACGLNSDLDACFVLQKELQKDLKKYFKNANI